MEPVFAFGLEPAAAKSTFRTMEGTLSPFEQFAHVDLDTRQAGNLEVWNPRAPRAPRDHDPLFAQLAHRSRFELALRAPRQKLRRVGHTQFPRVRRNLHLYELHAAVAALLPAALLLPLARAARILRLRLYSRRSSWRQERQAEDRWNSCYWLRFDARRWRWRRLRPGRGRRFRSRTALGHRDAGPRVRPACRRTPRQRDERHANERKKGGYLGAGSRARTPCRRFYGLRERRRRETRARQREIARRRELRRLPRDVDRPRQRDRARRRHVDARKWHAVGHGLRRERLARQRQRVRLGRSGERRAPRARAARAARWPVAARRPEHAPHRIVRVRGLAAPRRAFAPRDEPWQLADPEQLAEVERWQRKRF